MSKRMLSLLAVVAGMGGFWAAVVPGRTMPTIAPPGMLPTTVATAPVTTTRIVATTRAAATVPASAPATAQAAPRRTGANPADAVNRQLKVNIAWQVALDASEFSPGVLDGVFKRKGTMALTEYQTRYFPTATGPYDVKVFDALKVDVDGAVVPYQITDDDAAQVGGPLPDDWNAKAALKRMNYESMADCITEKFHCAQSLLEQLNPGVKMAGLKVGQTILVPNIRPFPTDYHLAIVRKQGAAWATVNLGEKTIRVYDKDGGELALFHCSIAKDKEKLPDRDTKVQVIASPNPNYTFNPNVWPEVHNVTQILTIPPGPRNPVGLSWVGLDLPGYGIHGSPKPEMIGKTGSHGCFRLTNWDALRFAGWVREGMPVKVISTDGNPA